MNSIKSFIRREPVLVISGIAALLSCFFVAPSAAYIGYIDFRVLGLLFCLMAVVGGLRSCYLFRVLAARLLAACCTLRVVAITLVLLPFFVSMLVTNDVALITFVPFAILILETIGRTDKLIYVIVLQTVAANLGSMTTPIGNPQNLYLYTHFGIPMSTFFSVMGPLAAASLAGLLALTLLIPKDPIEVEIEQLRFVNPKRPILYGILFALCLLTVLHLIPASLLTVLVAVTFLVLDREVLRSVDYLLLLTFVFFFIFSGNLGRIEAVKSFLSDILAKGTMLTSIAASQVISNVPAAVLLSGFTEDWRGLLTGTNIGGLGTLIASLASLISFKFYAATAEKNLLRYLGIFTLVNAAGLVLLTALAFLI